MAEVKEVKQKLRNGTGCDTSNDKSVINHDGLMTTNKPDSAKTLSRDEGSQEATKVVNIDKNNASDEKEEKVNANLSEHTESFLPVEIPLHISVNEGKKESELSEDGCLKKENLSSNQTPGKKVLASNNYDDLRSNKASDNGYKESTNGSDKGASRKQEPITTSLSKDIFELDNKSSSLSIVKTPPPLPRRQSEKVSI